MSAGSNDDEPVGDHGDEAAKEPSRRRLEDTSGGCRSLAQDDHDRAASVDSAHMRLRLEGSANAWLTRAALLERLEASFRARSETAPDDPPPEAAS